jgi:predicted phosphatase
MVAPTPEYRNISPMQNINALHLFLVILSVVSLNACTVNMNMDWQVGPIHALDKETSDLADVTADALTLADQTGKERVLMIFDIDNTILAMEQGLGADQWYEWQKDLANSDPCSAQNVGNRFAVQGAVFFASAMRPTQDDAAQQVKTIQDNGIPVIALTSRGPQYRLQTFRELRRNGYNFTHSAIGAQGGDNLPFVPIENGHLSRYEDGVFMTAGQHKGRMLYALLQRTGTTMPSVIVMADDKQKHLDSVKETFGALEVPVHAWRYSYEDENVRGFDPEQAHAEWESIETALRQIQQVLGPDNYDLSSAVLPPQCQ